MCFVQLFLEHHAAARRVEEEHDAELERRKGGGAKAVGGACEGGASGDVPAAEQSGIWHESESGLEWVASEGKMTNGGEEGKKEGEGEEEEETVPASSSQEDNHDDNFTKGELLCIARIGIRDPGTKSVSSQHFLSMFFVSVS